MYLGKSVTYCASCRGFVNCHLIINNNNLVKSIGFIVSKECPNFKKSAVQVVKLSIEKSIYDLKNELMKHKNIQPCIQPIWDSIKFACENLKKM